jgi:hypothetical protein
MVKVGAPVWVMVKVFPAMLRLAVRVAVVVLGATVKATEPFPFPDLPAVIAIQAAELDAVHVQPLSVVTEELPLPPV